MQLQHKVVGCFVRMVLQVPPGTVTQPLQDRVQPLVPDRVHQLFLGTAHQQLPDTVPQLLPDTAHRLLPGTVPQPLPGTAHQRPLDTALRQLLRMDHPQYLPDK